MDILFIHPFQELPYGSRQFEILLRLPWIWWLTPFLLLHRFHHRLHRLHHLLNRLLCWNCLHGWFCHHCRSWRSRATTEQHRLECKHWTHNGFIMQLETNTKFIDMQSLFTQLLCVHIVCGQLLCVHMLTTAHHNYIIVNGGEGMQESWKRATQVVHEVYTPLQLVVSYETTMKLLSPT